MFEFESESLQILWKWSITIFIRGFGFNNKYNNNRFFPAFPTKNSGQSIVNIDTDLVCSKLVSINN